MKSGILIPDFMLFDVTSIIIMQSQCTLRCRFLSQNGLHFAPKFPLLDSTSQIQYVYIPNC